MYNIHCISFLPTSPHVQTLLVQTWYPMTVCTNSRAQKEIIAQVQCIYTCIIHEAAHFYLENCLGCVELLVLLLLTLLAFFFRPSSSLEHVHLHCTYIICIVIILFPVYVLLSFFLLISHLKTCTICAHFLLSYVYYTCMNAW